MFKLQFLIFVFTILFSASVYTEEVIVFADSPYPPYVLGSHNDPQPIGGTAVNLVNQLFTELPNHRVRFQLLPWKRVLKNLEEGLVDGVTMVAKTPERERFLDFSAALIEYELALFYATSAFPDGFDWKSLADLSEFRIGVVEGYLSDSKMHELATNGAPLTLVRLSGTERQLFGMLLKGRVDLICFKLESGKTLLRRENWSNDIKPSQRSVYQGSYHLGFSKAQQHSVLIERLNELIGQWKESGKLDAILHPHSP